MTCIPTTLDSRALEQAKQARGPWCRSWAWGQHTNTTYRETWLPSQTKRRNSSSRTCYTTISPNTTSHNTRPKEHNKNP
eukprot:scaffold36298_cov122-Isochrysis_galbana.AAC.1